MCTLKLLTEPMNYYRRGFLVLNELVKLLDVVVNVLIDGLFITIIL